MSSINNTDDGDDFFASLCNRTNNTVVHGDGTIYRKWITVTIDVDGTIDNYSSSFTME